MRAVITVIGKDNVGILHKVSGVCDNYQANVLEVTQSVLQDMFAMIMMVRYMRMFKRQHKAMTANGDN